jgi:2-polyprenyl-6-hydroxyphenyl methylase / 3-demethylubiquinone-9 3-methyltransferase
MSKHYDDGEIERFNALAQSWWDPKGPMRPLHAMNPVRLGFIRKVATSHFSRAEAEENSLKNLRTLDVGCGAGLLSEPLARMGASVTAIDPAEENIRIAIDHASVMGLTINYMATVAEDLAQEGQTFDLITALEVIEHVPDPLSFMKTLASLLKPNGIVVLSTLNRTPLSYGLAILGAEYILRLLPIGTHEWQKFVKPHEMDAMAAQAGLSHVDTTGMAYNPLMNSWTLTANRLVNYTTAFTKPAA